MSISFLYFQFGNRSEIQVGNPPQGIDRRFRKPSKRRQISRPENRVSTTLHQREAPQRPTAQNLTRYRSRIKCRAGRPDS